MVNLLTGQAVLYLGGDNAGWRLGEYYEEITYDFHEGGMREVDQNKPRQGVIGFNRTGKPCSQGDSCSKFLNVFLGANAVAEYHDRILNSPDVQNSAYWRDSVLLNFSTIPHSVVVSYGAIVGENLRGCHHNPLAWQNIRDD